MRGKILERYSSEGELVLYESLKVLQDGRKELHNDGYETDTRSPRIGFPGDNKLIIRWEMVK